MKTKLFLLVLPLLLAACSHDEPVIIPKAKFSYTATDLTVTFKNQSTNALSYSWDFGNGQTSTLTNPTITYSAAGTYPVHLTAFRGEKKDTYKQSVFVSYKQPTASFTYTTAHPLKVVLNNTSSNATSYVWDFGDGYTSTEQNPTHKYDGIGVYKVQLTAKNGSKSAIYQSNVTIEAPTKCYITGFTVIKIPNNNYYFQAQLTDDYDFMKTTYFYTNWFLLSSANIPYLYSLTSQKLLDTSKTYVLRLYKSSSKPTGQATGKGFWTMNLKPIIFSIYPENWEISDDEAGVEAHFLWE